MTEEVIETTVEEITEPVMFEPPVDVDSTWDGKGSLDDHRQAEFAKLKQSGFGDSGKVKVIADGE